MKSGHHLFHDRASKGYESIPGLMSAACKKVKIGFKKGQKEAMLLQQVQRFIWAKKIF